MASEESQALGFWDQQFKFSAILPDFETCLARMQTRSNAVDLSFERHATGRHPRQYIETCGVSATSRVIPVFIHGGYWRGLSAQMHRFLLPNLLNLAGCAANVEYRLLPEVSLGQIVEDVLAAIDCLAKHSACQVVTVGHSAGGHLAVLAALRRPDIVKGALSISGLYDLAPLKWSFLQDEVGLIADDLIAYSPQRLWQGLTAQNITLAYGAHETAEFRRQAHVFSSAYGAHVISVPGAHHMTVLDALADPNSSLIANLREITQA